MSNPAFVAAFAALLRKHPEEFHHSLYRLTHLRSGLSLWIASGFWYLRFEQDSAATSWDSPPRAYRPTLWERWTLWRAYRKYRRALDATEAAAERASTDRMTKTWMEKHASR